MIFTAVACDKEPKDGPDPKYPTPQPGVKYTLEGTVNTPGFTWKTNSSIGLYSATEGVKIVNKECKIDGWADTNLKDEEGNPLPYTPSPYEGQATAPFQTPELDLVAGPNEFMAYTPYDAELTYLSDIIYSLNVGQDQVQPVANVASDCFAYGTFTGTPGVDETFKFTLEPITALLKVAISSTEFAGLSVTKIDLVDRNGVAAIGGAFNINVKTKEVSTIEGYGLSGVAVQVTRPTPIVTGTPQNFYIQSLPFEAGGTNDIWLVISMESESKYVTIPVKIDNLKLTAGQTTEITFDDIKSSDCSLAWYCPVETRKQPALGYCYGEANCYLIQCKNGQIYPNATYTPDSSIPDEITIDFRARGNFANAIDPTGATFEWFQQAGKTYLPQVAGYTNVTNSDQFTITPDPASYTVKVKNTGAIAGAPILVMKKNGKILWAWSFWNISADGTQLKAVKTGDFELANMDLGQNTTNFKVWAANPYQSGGATRADVNYRFNYYYQWGRPTPVNWSSWPTNNFFDATGGNVPVVEGPVTFAGSLENPVALILKNSKEGGSARIGDWADDNNRYGDLWGGGLNEATVTEEGTKTIYDPCPKGWRVPDPAVFEHIAPGTLTTDKEVAGAYTLKFSTAGENFFTFNGRFEDYIATNGRVATMGMPAEGKQTTQGHLWTNWVGWHNGVQPRIFTFSNTSASATTTINRAIAASVRCQKDTHNR